MKTTTTRPSWVVLAKLRGRERGRSGMSSCKYVAQGQVSFRMCPRGGRCERCSFAQMIEDLS